MAQIDGGSDSAGKANVDAGFNLNVNLPQNLELSGYNRPMSEVDFGRSRGEAFLLAGEVSEDFRARVELDTQLDTYTFNDVLQNTSKHIYRTTTMTDTWAGGFLNTNASAITTINTGTLFLTYQYFPINAGAETYAYFKLKFTGTWAVTNTTIDVGFLGTPAVATPYAPTDGAYFRANSSGLFGVLNNNGTEDTTAAFISPITGLAFAPTIGTEYDCIVTIGENAVVFWIDFRDGNGYAMAGRLTTPIGSGRPLLSASVQFGIRHAIGGSAASAVMGAAIASYGVSQGGYNFNRPIATQMTMMGASSAQGQSGHSALTSTALYTNSLAAGAGAAATNTTAALGSGLGGQFSVQPTLAAGTDGIIASYQNPAPSNVITGRQLIITGILIDGLVTTALTGGPVLYAWSLAWGHTAVSLATTEAATTKSPRRKALGFQGYPVTAAVGQQPVGGQLYIPLDDVVVNPGEFIQAVAKNLGTVTSAGVITCLVTFTGHWA